MTKKPYKRAVSDPWLDFRLNGQEDTTTEEDDPDNRPRRSRRSPRHRPGSTRDTEIGSQAPDSRPPNTTTTTITTFGDTVPTHLSDRHAAHEQPSVRRSSRIPPSDGVRLNSSTGMRHTAIRRHFDSLPRRAARTSAPAASVPTRTGAGGPTVSDSSQLPSSDSRQSALDRLRDLCHERAPELTRWMESQDWVTIGATVGAVLDVTVPTGTVLYFLFPQTLVRVGTSLSPEAFARLMALGAAAVQSSQHSSKSK